MSEHGFSFSVNSLFHVHKYTKLHRPHRILFDTISNSSATSLYDVPLLRYYSTGSFLNDDVYRFPCFDFGVDILFSFVAENHMSIHMVCMTKCPFFQIGTDIHW